MERLNNCTSCQRLTTLVQKLNSKFKIYKEKNIQNDEFLNTFRKQNLLMQALKDELQQKNTSLSECFGKLKSSEVECLALQQTLEKEKEDHEKRLKAKFKDSDLELQNLKTELETSKTALQAQNNANAQLIGKLELVAKSTADLEESFAEEKKRLSGKLAYAEKLASSFEKRLKVWSGLQDKKKELARSVLATVRKWEKCKEAAKLEANLLSGLDDDDVLDLEEDGESDVSFSSPKKNKMNGSCAVTDTSDDEFDEVAKDTPPVGTSPDQCRNDSISFPFSKGDVGGGDYNAMSVSPRKASLRCSSPRKVSPRKVSPRQASPTKKSETPRDIRSAGVQATVDFRDAGCDPIECENTAEDQPENRCIASLRVQCGPLSGRLSPFKDTCTPDSESNLNPIDLMSSKSVLCHVCDTLLSKCPPCYTGFHDLVQYKKSEDQQAFGYDSFSREISTDPEAIGSVFSPSRPRKQTSDYFCITDVSPSEKDSLTFDECDSELVKRDVNIRTMSASQRRKHACTQTKNVSLENVDSHCASKYTRPAARSVSSSTQTDPNCVPEVNAKCNLCDKAGMAVCPMREFFKTSLNSVINQSKFVSSLAMMEFLETSLNTLIKQSDFISSCSGIFSGYSSLQPVNVQPYYLPPSGLFPANPGVPFFGAYGPSWYFPDDPARRMRQFHSSSVPAFKNEKCSRPNSDYSDGEESERKRRSRNRSSLRRSVGGQQSPQTRSQRTSRCSTALPPENKFTDSGESSVEEIVVQEGGTKRRLRNAENVAHSRKKVKESSRLRSLSSSESSGEDSELLSENRNFEVIQSPLDGKRKKPKTKSYHKSPDRIPLPTNAFSKDDLPLGTSRAPEKDQDVARDEPAELPLARKKRKSRLSRETKDQKGSPINDPPVVDFNQESSSGVPRNLEEPQVAGPPFDRPQSLTSAEGKSNDSFLRASRNQQESPFAVSVMNPPQSLPVEREKIENSTQSTRNNDDSCFAVPMSRPPRASASIRRTKKQCEGSLQAVTFVSGGTIEPSKNFKQTSNCESSSNIEAIGMVKEDAAVLTDQQAQGFKHYKTRSTVTSNSRCAETQKSVEKLVRSQTPRHENTQTVKSISTGKEDILRNTFVIPETSKNKDMSTKRDLVENSRNQNNGSPQKSTSLEAGRTLVTLEDDLCLSEDSDVETNTNGVEDKDASIRKQGGVSERQEVDTPVYFPETENQSIRITRGADDEDRDVEFSTRKPDKEVCTEDRTESASVADKENIAEKRTRWASDVDKEISEERKGSAAIADREKSTEERTECPSAADKENVLERTGSVSVAGKEKIAEEQTECASAADKENVLELTGSVSVAEKEEIAEEQTECASAADKENVLERTGSVSVAEKEKIAEEQTECASAADKENVLERTGSVSVAGKEKIAEEQTECASAADKENVLEPTGSVSVAEKEKIAEEQTECASAADKENVLEPTGSVSVAEKEKIAEEQTKCASTADKANVSEMRTGSTSIVEMDKITEERTICASADYKGSAEDRKASASAADKREITKDPIVNSSAADKRNITEDQRLCVSVADEDVIEERKASVPRKAISEEWTESASAADREVISEERSQNSPAADEGNIADDQIVGASVTKKALNKDAPPEERTENASAADNDEVTEEPSQSSPAADDGTADEQTVGASVTDRDERTEERTENASAADKEEVAKEPTQSSPAADQGNADDQTVGASVTDKDVPTEERTGNTSAADREEIAEGPTEGSLDAYDRNIADDQTVSSSDSSLQFLADKQALAGQEEQTGSSSAANNVKVSEELTESSSVADKTEIMRKLTDCASAVTFITENRTGSASVAGKDEITQQRSGSAADKEVTYLSETNIRSLVDRFPGEVSSNHFDLLTNNEGITTAPSIFGLSNPDHGSKAAQAVKSLNRYVERLISIENCGSEHDTGDAASEETDSCSALSNVHLYGDREEKTKDSSVVEDVSNDEGIDARDDGDPSEISGSLFEDLCEGEPNLSDVGDLVAAVLPDLSFDLDVNSPEMVIDADVGCEEPALSEENKACNSQNEAHDLLTSKNATVAKTMNGEPDEVSECQKEALPKEIPPSESPPDGSNVETTSNEKRDEGRLPAKPVASTRKRHIPVIAPPMWPYATRRASRAASTLKEKETNATPTIDNPQESSDVKSTANRTSQRKNGAKPPMPTKRQKISSREFISSDSSSESDTEKLVISLEEPKSGISPDDCSSGKLNDSGSSGLSMVVDSEVDEGSPECTGRETKTRQSSKRSPQHDSAVPKKRGRCCTKLSVCRRICDSDSDEVLSGKSKTDGSEESPDEVLKNSSPRTLRPRSRQSERVTPEPKSRSLRNGKGPQSPPSESSSSDKEFVQTNETEREGVERDAPSSPKKTSKLQKLRKCLSKAHPLLQTPAHKIEPPPLKKLKTDTAVNSSVQSGKPSVGASSQMAKSGRTVCLLSSNPKNLRDRHRPKDPPKNISQVGASTPITNKPRITPQERLAALQLSAQSNGKEVNPQSDEQETSTQTGNAVLPTKPRLTPEETPSAPTLLGNFKSTPKQPPETPTNAHIFKRSNSIRNLLPKPAVSPVNSTVLDLPSTSVTDLINETHSFGVEAVIPPRRGFVSIAPKLNAPISSVSSTIPIAPIAKNVPSPCAKIKLETPDIKGSTIPASKSLPAVGIPVVQQSITHTAQESSPCGTPGVSRIKHPNQIWVKPAMEVESSSPTYLPTPVSNVQTLLRGPDLVALIDKTPRGDTYSTDLVKEDHHPLFYAWKQRGANINLIRSHAGVLGQGIGESVPAIKNLLNTYLKSPYFTEELLTRTVNSLLNPNHMYLDVIVSRLIVDMVEVDYDSQPCIDSRGPGQFLTKIQQQLIALIMRLFPKYQSIIKDVLILIEHRMYSLGQSTDEGRLPWLAVLHTSLCRIMKWREVALIFCYDAMYCYVSRFATVLSSVFMVWPELLPDKFDMRTTGGLLQVMFHFIMTQGEPDKNPDLKTLRAIFVMKKVYSGHTNSTELTQKVMQDLRDDNCGPISPALILISKRQDVPWTQDKIVNQHLLPMVRDWLLTHNDPSCAQLPPAAVTTLCGIVRAFRGPEPAVETTHTLMKTLLDTKKVGDFPALEHAICGGLVSLSRHNVEFVVDILKKWKPKNRVPKWLIDIMEALMNSRARPSGWWAKEMSEILKRVKIFPITSKACT